MFASGGCSPRERVLLTWGETMFGVSEGRSHSVHCSRYFCPARTVTLPRQVRITTVRVGAVAIDYVSGELDDGVDEVTNAWFSNREMSAF